MAIVTIGFNPAIDRILECPDFHIGGHQSARQIARLAAGKAANVSRALALLSVDNIAAGFVGMDDLEFFQTELMATGPGRILCRYIEVGGKTRENISILDPKRRLETHLRDKGFTVVEEECELLQKKIAHEMQAGDVAVFAGSLCEGADPDYLVSLINMCNGQGAKVVVDSSGDALAAAAKQKLWLIKPNVEELRQLVGAGVADTVESICQYARPLLANIEQVLVSRGSNGAVLFTPDGQWSATLLRQHPAIRTVGCGDHLLAGYISQRVAGRDAEVALRTAVAVGTARALSTDMSEISADDIKEVFSGVAVERV